jgi:hypothetical protein
MNVYVLLSAVLSTFLFFMSCVQVLRGRSQSLASWVLWLTLTGVAAATLIVQGGNYAIALAYLIGNMAVVVCILKSGNAAWGAFESFIVVIVCLCLGVIWTLSNARITTIVTTIAFVAAGLPQLRDTYRKPWDTPALVYAGYSLACGLSAAAGRDWSVEERLFPITLTISNLLTAVMALRKFWIRQGK